jgi:truncated hemoglobin YjbI
MRTVLGALGRPIVATAVASLLLSGSYLAQPPGGKDAKGMPKGTDKEIRAALKDVINRGADLFNPPRNDHDACARLYQGALMAVRPMLRGRGDLDKAITQVLIEADRIPAPDDRAFKLRAVLDRIRKELAPKKGGEKKIEEKTKDNGKKVGDEGKKPDKEPDSGKKTEKKATLWKRLGGEAGVRKVVGDFIKSAAKDPKVDFTRGGKYKVDKDMLETALVEMISGATGGPLRYTGPDMAKVHKGMHITAAEFDRTVEHLKRALRKNAAAKDATRELLKIVETTRKTIVEPAATKGTTDKEDDKKADDKGKDIETPDGKGKKTDDEATLSGKITYKGKPLPGGPITLVNQGGKRTRVTVAADGSYGVKDSLAAGEFIVTVETDSVKPAVGKGDRKGKRRKGEQGQTPSNYVAIPARYGTAETSGLRVTLAKGANVFDIDLQ